MFHPVSIFIGLRYLRGRSGDRFSRFVSYMSTAGITVGVMSLVTVLSVMNGFEAQLKERILGVLPQAVVSMDGGKTPHTTPPDFVRALSPRYQPTPLVRSEAVIQSPSQLSVGYLIGIEPSADDPIENHLIAGRLSQLEAGKYQVFLGHSLARSLNVSMGDKVRLMVTSASQFTPLGRIPSQRNFTVAGMFNTGSDIDGQLMVTHIEDAGRLLRLPSKTISGWRLYFDDPFQVTEAANTPLPDGWQWSDWRAQRGELFQAVKMEKNMMGLMLGLIVAVAAFNIISALIMVVMEKQSEVAILKTQGMNSYGIMAIFMVQGASSGIIGSLFGGAAGVLLSQNLNTILETAGVALFTFGGSLPVLIQPFQIVAVVVLAVLLSLLATLYPSYRASSVKPAEALRYE
ncbi:lipoprotein-releasing ABC transporter permease subunit LolC [Vibrio vulnificus]|uniref:Lipoprotein-releasing system transmembrane subunit LolC n=1 Tax=Vibrio vulnificus TaxID=672 RepID=A0A2S3R3V6_VIBVL|nr:lipoprotein-releasing ABC transporter permease subunit LolC [Vibrio vulnificus]EJV9310350.1 lipoprotein-releasing ABC transporter permease subunit LolC [Vibrio vulnificus]ELM6648308.1 lipoprotein-releasing ABC transporter permease subunit LolC [Vibrio vulnificus]ELP6756406.1 lipoprotein-releasing ABC transporter permease subunit LolC [Vibrio vulnificus]MBN8109888.1 lipoprotein-releasing ABC transporter permease subunit LolC [Vibrio vulnificus]MBN8113594.1 lipoprotein-releasing ABC transport